MNKITFMGAGSTVFVRNVLGDCMCTQSLRDWEFALYDIDPVRLQESFEIISAMNRTKGGHGKVTAYLGVENRKEALRGARFVINAIQVGLYDPCTIIDFEVPKKYGLRQTIGDTLGIGGIMRALRTIPVMDDFARDMQEVCPDALFLNYTNPMAMLSGYMQRYTGIETVGLCHSVQVCSEFLLKELGMEDKLEGRRERIAGINHMSCCWSCGTKTATTCIRKSAAGPSWLWTPTSMGKLRTPPTGWRKPAMTWCVWTTSAVLATTARNPASTTPNTICSTSNPSIRSSLTATISLWTNTPAAA